MSEHDRLIPPPPRRERRKWTRAEDYVHPRRMRGAKPAIRHGQGSGLTEPANGARPMLGAIPFILVMLGLGVLAFAIMLVAVPGAGKRAAAPEGNTQAQQQQRPAETGDPVRMRLPEPSRPAPAG